MVKLKDTFALNQLLRTTRRKKFTLILASPESVKININGDDYLLKTCNLASILLKTCNLASILTKIFIARLQMWLVHIKALVYAVLNFTYIVH